jgi:hypothetical protein
MPCYHPLRAWKSKLVNESGRRSMVFKSQYALNPDDPIDLPCGKCIGCRLERSRQWAIRCVHEASLYDENCSITLTYDNEHLPSDGSLDVRHVQLFFKRLRKELKGRKIRYFLCGEYGENLGRPHYHACIFNYDFPDKVHFKNSGSGHKLYFSEFLTKVWGMGHCLIGDLTFESAAYAARYITKKVSGTGGYDRKGRKVLTPEEHYGEKKPEFITMSRRPGIGSAWLEKWKDDVYPHDYIVLNGKKMKPPKFYDDHIDQFEMDDIKAERVKHLDKYDPERSLRRLEVKEQVKLSRTELLQRSFESD